MGARAHRDAGAVDHGRDIVRMRVFHLEGNQRALFARAAHDLDAVDAREFFRRVFQERLLVRGDALFSDGIYIIDGSREANRGHDRGRQPG